ncbi:MAG TPA: Gfo/Idh/MocA family oxidoreductase, partial [Terriglobales bacterium]|nr:Gfo/Idh/MocA family oxidoreductase [Terriglobales bacterium]
TSFTRRQFLRRTSLAVGATLTFPDVGNVLGANDRVNVACIGIGGKGDSDSSEAAKCGANIVAICDVDKTHLASTARQFEGKFPDMKQYQDYRKMLEEMDKSIDAVTVSTPDHHHGVAAIRAMKLGKHCFCQKPLVQTVHEARIVRQLAKDKNLATQMGNQGSALPGLRRAVEVIQAGVIGNPLELHVWSNRPIWPQGLDRPEGSDPVPNTLDWDIWLGRAKERPYKSGVYHDFKWRGWYDFGTGALGDMACHTVNMPFRALKLGYPNVVELELCSRMYPETFPKSSRIRYEFPEREGLPPLKFWWYDGNPETQEGKLDKPLRPDAEAVREIVNTFDKLPISGALIIGEKGKLFSDDDYGTRFFVSMKGKDEMVKGDELDIVKSVPQTIPRSPGHMQEWFRMIKDGTPAYSNFEIAGYLAEVILLGCVALRLGEDRRMEWDGPNMKSPNQPDAANFVSVQNRAGWEA